MLECLEFLGIPNSEPLIRSDHILSRNVQVSWRAHRFIYHLLLDTILHCMYTCLNFSINEIGLSDIGDIYIFRFVCFCLVFACLKCFDKSPKAEFKEKMQVFSEQNAGEKHEK